MADLKDPRSNIIVWILRIFQLVFAIIVLGITGSTAADYHSIGCPVPSSLGWNIAVAVLTMLVLFYLIPATGPLGIVPTHVYAVLAIDFVFWVFWLAAAGSSPNVLESSCVVDFYDGFGDGYAGYFFVGGSKLQAKMAFDSLETIFWFATMVFTAVLIFTSGGAPFKRSSPAGGTGGNAVPAGPASNV